VYRQVVAALKASPEINDKRIAAQLQLQREFGLRNEEAFRFQLARAVFRDGTVFVQHGTKGWRERIIQHVAPAAKEAIAYANESFRANAELYIPISPAMRKERRTER
jgi:hypothetical protein